MECKGLRERVGSAPCLSSCCCAWRVLVANRARIAAKRGARFATMLRPGGAARDVACLAPVDRGRPTRGANVTARRHVASVAARAQGTPEFGALALDGHQLRLGCRRAASRGSGDRRGRCRAGGRGTSGRAIPDGGAARCGCAARRRRDRWRVPTGTRRWQGCGDDRVFGEDRPAFEDDGAGGLVDEHEALDALVGVQDQA